jgi:2,3-bisphosphoglycerate-independent phosphoglycerate mutase
MADFDLIRELCIPAATKIVLLVLDGLGGLPQEPGGPTELETAHKPNLDRLASQGILGLTQPVGPGITPGSGPGHLALFGYDPRKYVIGRGALEAMGIDFALHGNDLAARGNFCTMDASGAVTDRRAGRIPTTECARLCAMLRQIALPGVELFVEPVQDYRFVLVLRGEGLADELTETDPQAVGVAPLEVKPLAPAATRSAELVNAFVARARALLARESPANMVLLRGFARHPRLPQFPEIYGLRAAGVAVYPMYRGLARLVGMELVKPEGGTPADEFAAVASRWSDYDFFYVHIKRTDSCGEDGKFADKVAVIEEVDRALPSLLTLRPDVLMVGADHSTPAVLKAHSWHPVPFLLAGPLCRPDGIAEFGERACARGSLGTFPADQLMMLAMAHACRLCKFGA